MPGHRLNETRLKRFLGLLSFIYMISNSDGNVCGDAEYQKIFIFFFCQKVY